MTTDKEFVLSIYPDAQIKPYYGIYWVMQLQTFEAGIVFNPMTKTEEELWSIGRKVLEQRMLEKLES